MKINEVLYIEWRQLKSDWMHVVISAVLLRRLIQINQGVINIKGNFITIDPAHRKNNTFEL